MQFKSILITQFSKFLGEDAPQTQQEAWKDLWS